MACIYWIHHKSHTDIFAQGYVGFSKNSAEKRYQGHVYSANTSDLNYPVLNAIRKYGDELVLETVVIGPDDYCIELENKLRPDFKIGWNLDKGGRVGCIGRVASAETRLKQSIAKIGKSRSKEATAKIAAARTGVPLTDATKYKLSKLAKQRGQSKQHKDAILAANALRKGTKQTAEHVATVNLYKAQNPWMFSKRKDTWKIAEKVYDLFVKSYRACDVSKELGIDKGTLFTLYRKIKQGWNPYTDNNYQTWLTT